MKVYDNMEAWRKQAKIPVKMTCLYHMATCANFVYTCGVTPTKPQLATKFFSHADCKGTDLVRLLQDSRLGTQCHW